MASRLDAATGQATTTGFNYSISAGSNRGLIVCIEQEGTTLGQPTASYGGNSMAVVADIEVNPGTTSQRVTAFFLNESGIAGAGSTAIAVGNVATSVTVHAASYQDCAQTTPTNTATDGSTAATPNPLTTVDITTSAPDSVVVSFAGMGNSGTAAWGADLTEQTEVVDSGATATGSYADAEVASSSVTVNCECTWTTQNRTAQLSFEIANAGGAAVLQQEGYRWYNDGSESGSTARQNQDTADTVSKETTVQLRTIVNVTSGNPNAVQYQLEYKETADADAEYRKVPLT